MTTHRGSAYILPAALAALAAACDGPDISVASMEITQAVQTPTNTITLIAQRSTAIRATLRVLGTGSPITGVTGKLHAFVGSAEITPPGGLAPINAPFTAPLSPQRSNENDTLNFELPAPTGLTASANVSFRVDLDPVTGETVTANNSGLVDNLTFVDRVTPLLYFTRINYTPSGLGMPSTALIQPGTGDAFVRGILPVNDAEPTLYQQGLFPSLPYGEDANGDGRLDALGTDGNNLISLLASCRQLIVNSGVGASDRIFLFGWLAGNPIDGNGLGEVGGRNAFGNTDPVRSQRSYAHELTHNFGLNHNSRNLDQVDWDVGARMPGNPAGNNTLGRVKPTTLFDVQAAGKLTNQAWVDSTTYNALLGHSSLSSSSPDQDKDQPRVAVIQGQLDPTGRALRSFKQVFRYPWASRPRLRTTGAFTAELTDDAGAVTKASFDGLVADDPDRTPEDERAGFFEVMVPVAPGREISQLRILGRGELLNLKRTQPPKVTVVTPASGAQLGERTEVSWRIVDADTMDDQILVQVAYSPDAGRSFVPVAVDVKASAGKVSFDSTEIRKSMGTGLIRVFASDGLNTASEDATKLSAIAARY